LLTLTLLVGLARLFAFLAPDREGKRAQALLGNFLAALKAVAVGALLEPRERIHDFAERLRFHLDEREFDLILDVVFRALNGIDHVRLLRAPRALGADVAHLALNL